MQVYPVVPSVAVKNRSDILLADNALDSFKPLRDHIFS